MKKFILALMLLTIIQGSAYANKIISVKFTGLEDLTQAPTMMPDQIRTFPITARVEFSEDDLIDGYYIPSASLDVTGLSVTGSAENSKICDIEWIPEQKYIQITAKNTGVTNYTVTCSGVLKVIDLEGFEDFSDSNNVTKLIAVTSDGSSYEGSTPSSSSGGCNLNFDGTILIFIFALILIFYARKKFLS